MQGATATVSLRQPRTEAHLSQLAVLENFAEHGLYVKFSNEEAEELEREALALALEESTQEVGSDRGRSELSPVAFSREEADQVAAQLMEAAPPNVPSNGRKGRQQAPPLKSARSGSFKGLFGFNRDKNKKGKAAEDASRQQQQQHPPQPMAQSQPARPHVPSMPAKSTLASPTSPKKGAKVASSPRKVAFQASARSESQNGFSGSSYDSALKDARALRAELEGGLKQYRGRNDSLIKQMNMLHARLQRKNPTVQAVEELKQAQIQVETAEVQLDVIEEGIDELCSLESYMQRTHPPDESATLLAHEVVRQLLACLSHVGVQSKVLQATPLQGNRATRPDQSAERLVNHFRKESRAESPKPLPSLPDIPEEALDADDSQELQEEDMQVPATEPQTPPKQSANKAFLPERPDRSKPDVGIVKVHPLPARHTLAPAQDNAERPRGTISIVDAQPLPAQHTTPPASSQDVSGVPEQSVQSVGIAEAHPLPARHDTPAAFDSAPGEMQGRDGQDASSALRAHALADISSPASSMPEGTTKSALQAHVFSAHHQQHGSEASGVEDSSPEASVTGRSAAGRSKGDAEEDLSGATSYASAAHDTLPDSADEPYHDFWGGQAETAQAAVEGLREAALGRGPGQQEVKDQVLALPSGQDRDASSAQHEQHVPEPLRAHGSPQHTDSSTAVTTCSEDLGNQAEREEAEREEAEQERAKREAAAREQEQQAEHTEQEQSAKVGQPAIPDLGSTDLLGSRALGPLGLALKDSGELPARPAAGPEPALTQASPQQSVPESLQRTDSDAAHRKKKRSGFGSLFKRKGSPVNGIQEALNPPGPKPKAQPQADADHAAPATQQSSAAREPASPARAEARLEEDAVDRAAAAQLRLAAQSASQGKVPERPVALEASSSGPVDAAVAKQSSISTKLAGASMPSLGQGTAEADSASSADSSTSNYANAGPASSSEAAPPVEATTPRSAGGAAARSSAVRSRVRSAGARQRRGGASGDGSLRTAAAPQELRENAEVDTLFQELDQIIPNNFMSQTFEDSSASLVSATPPSSTLTPAQRELAELDAQKHAGLVQSVATDISEYRAPDMPALVEFVRDTSARLGVIMTDEAAVLAQFPTWPQAKWTALRDAADAFSELSDFSKREKQWLLQRGTCEEEVQRMEAFLDTVMARTQGLAARGNVREAEWKQHSIPWNASIYSSVRVNSLHLATLYMSRVLFEVASLERSEDTVQEACLRHLAAGVRATHKIYHFAGGFDAELSALFDKVRRLAKYYVRVLAPPR